MVPIASCSDVCEYSVANDSAMDVFALTPARTPAIARQGQLWSVVGECSHYVVIRRFIAIWREEGLIACFTLNFYTHRYSIYRKEHLSFKIS